MIIDAIVLINRVVLIIQARVGSTRLPGKSLMDLAGKPLVARLLERVKRCKNIDEIVLAGIGAGELFRLLPGVAGTGSKTRASGPWSPSPSIG